MKITRVEPIHLRLPDVREVADGTQDCLVVRLYTDAGFTGLGEVTARSRPSMMFGWSPTKSAGPSEGMFFTPRASMSMMEGINFLRIRSIFIVELSILSPAWDRVA